MNHFDITGRLIEVLDCVAVPRAISGSPFMNIGLVVKLNPKTIVVREISTTKYLKQDDGSQITVEVDPYLDTDHIVKNPNRVLVIESDYLPRVYRIALNDIDKIGDITKY